MMSNLKSAGSGGDGDESNETAKAKGLEIKEARDSIAELLSKEECTKDCDESTLRVAQIFIAISNSMMAECGIIEEEKHSSLSYVEEHADELFVDGGKRFKEQMDLALAKGRLHNLMNDATYDAELEKLAEEGDTEGRLRLMKERIRAVGEQEDAVRDMQGLPLDTTREDLFIGTIIDDELFAPPPPPPDCPICFLSLQILQTSYQPCCGKVSIKIYLWEDA